MCGDDFNDFEQPRWEPMDTAPDDGSTFLALDDEGRMLVVWRYGDSWRMHMPDGQPFEVPNLTHWMPLPDPPPEPSPGTLYTGLPSAAWSVLYLKPVDIT